ncbi:serine/threonine-protein kinase [Nocardioides sp. CPCC 205120]|uniref:serine/threonine-protein kinase n=1 Tax=Nocardioides sp. CPCC 205120 TaxID=3406462 RepID=UPI003B514D04
MTGEERTDGAWRPPASPARPPTTEPEDVPGYVELTEVGRGGDSVVYRGRQVSPHRVVAIKVLGTDDPTRAARFRREVEITIELGRQHPNIVNLLDVGTTGAGRPYLVMDFVEAGTVHDRLRAHGPLPVHEVVELGYVLADALAFAHERGVLHRDVKPQNVLVLPTSWVLADFGIARMAGSEHTSSVETFTYRHAAPQVLDGMKPSRADDLWSLGSTLFTLLDGRPPFASDDPDEDSALAYIRRARTEPHRTLDVPGAERLAGIIDRCLAKPTEERWATAGELRDALGALRTSAWLPSVEPAGPARPAGPAVPIEPIEPAPAPTGPTDPTPTAPRPHGGSGPSPVPAAPAAPPAAPATVPPVVAPAPVEPGWAPGASADPEPLALSALAHAPVDTTPDAAPTSTGASPAAATGPAAADGEPGRGDGGGGRGDRGGRRGRRDRREPAEDGPVDPHEPRRRRSLVVLAVLALVAGLGLGVVGFGLRGGDDEAERPQQTPTVGDVPTASTPPAADPPLDPRPDPELAVVFQTLDASGLDLELAWTDPSEGTARFFVARTSGPQGSVVSYEAELAPGTREVVLPGALAAGGRQCYAILLVMPTGPVGLSEVRCITAPTP